MGQPCAIADVEIWVAFGEHFTRALLVLLIEVAPEVADGKRLDSLLEQRVDASDQLVNI